MATTVYLASGDVFEIGASCVDMIEAMESGGFVTVESVRWRNPDADDFDDESTLPVFTSTSIHLRASEIVAVERCAEHIERIIERAREVQSAIQDG